MDLPNLQEFFEGLEYVLGKVFPGGLPSWVIPACAYGIIAGVLLSLILGLLTVLNKIKHAVKELLPFFPSIEEKRRIHRRRLFADHVESEIRRLNGLESWHDYRFTELEAEVEAEGKRRRQVPLSFLLPMQTGLRREKSLSDALRRSDERLVLLEGEPGAGKSVALRHLAFVLAQNARQSRSPDSLIPLYVNLKEFGTDGLQIGKNLLRSFVFKYLNRINDRDIEEFLEEEFEEGLRQGTWLFLFDSFDEIPGVLAATEADATVREYAGAISDFLHGLNQCRGIVASRLFRGPTGTGWPTFRILPLTEKRQIDLVRKVGLPPGMQQALIGSLATAPTDVRLMAGNPMFLGLISEHVRSGLPFPANAHSAFESYIDRRLWRDEERLHRRFGLDVGEVKHWAEVIAFSMAADPALGLSPSRPAICNSMTALDFGLAGDIDRYFDALEYLKLARSEQHAVRGDGRTFTFAHRRFQEYFATRVVLQEPDRVLPLQLLVDARWRETAVVLCQTQALEILQPLLEEATRLLGRSATDLESALGQVASVAQDDGAADPVPSGGASSSRISVPWPTHVLHILGLLQDGFSGRAHIIPEALHVHAATIVERATERGTLSDQKWALEVAGILPADKFIEVVRKAFDSRSRWLREIAYRQVGRMASVPDDVRQQIRETLIMMCLSGRLRTERIATQAHLLRLREARGLTDVARLLLWVPWIDTLLHFVLGILQITVVLRHPDLTTAEACAAAGFLMLVLFISHRALRRSSTFSNIVFWRINAYFMTLLFLLILQAPSNGLVLFHQSLFLAIGGLYSVIWAPSALLAALEQKLISPPFWFLAPIVPVVRVFSFLKGNPGITWYIGTVLSICASIVIFFQKSLEQWLPYITIPLIIPAFPIFLSLARDLSDDLRDWTRWLKWSKQPLGLLEHKQVSQLLMKCLTPKGQMRRLRRIRSERLLIPSQAALKYLELLGWEVDSNVRKNLKATSDERLRGRDYFRLWLQNMSRSIKAYGRVLSGQILLPRQITRDDSEANFDLRDEVYLLAEQVRETLSIDRGDS